MTASRVGTSMEGVTRVMNGPVTETHTTRSQVYVAERTSKHVMVRRLPHRPQSFLQRPLSQHRTKVPQLLLEKALHPHPQPLDRIPNLGPLRRYVRMGGCPLPGCSAPPLLLKGLLGRSTFRIRLILGRIPQTRRWTRVQGESRGWEGDSLVQLGSKAQALRTDSHTLH